MITSIFAEITEQIFKYKNLDEARTYITEFVNVRKINEKDKLTILRNINECKHITKLQSYICHSLLKYEGMGLTTTPQKHSI